MANSEKEVLDKLEELNRELNKIQEEFNKYEAEPKGKSDYSLYHTRLHQQLGQKLTKLNYKIGNQMVFLDKYRGESDPVKKTELLRAM